MHFHKLNLTKGSKNDGKMLLWFVMNMYLPISYQIVKDTSMTQLRKYEDMTHFRLGNVVKVTKKSPKDMCIYF